MGSFKFIQEIRLGPEHRGDAELLFVQIDAGGYIGVCADDEAREAPDECLVLLAEARAEAGDIPIGGVSESAVGAWFRAPARVSAMS